MNELEDTTAVPEEKEECSACGYALAGIGLILGLSFLYISVDVFTGGKLTASLGLGTARNTVIEGVTVDGN
jgi:hypothetical protein